MHTVRVSHARGRAGVPRCQHEFASVPILLIIDTGIAASALRALSARETNGAQRTKPALRTLCAERTTYARRALSTAITRETGGANDAFDTSGTHLALRSLCTWSGD